MNIIDTKASGIKFHNKHNLIKNIPLFDISPIKYKLEENNFTHVIFQSVSSVECFKDYQILNDKKVFSMGLSTNKALDEKGIVSSCPEIPGSEGLKSIINDESDDSKYLIIKGRDGLNIIEDHLNQKNIFVEKIICYERKVFESYDDLKKKFLDVDAIIFPSVLAAKIYFNQLHDRNKKNTKFFGISERINNFIKAHGHNPILINYFSENLELDIKEFI